MPRNDFYSRLGSEFQDDICKIREVLRSVGPAEENEEEKDTENHLQELKVYEIVQREEEEEEEENAAPMSAGNSQLLSDEEDVNGVENEFDATLESCLEFNRVYQELIAENIYQVEMLLAKNKEKQTLLQDNLENKIKRRGSGPDQAQGWAMTRTVFSIPYFKDVDGNHQPHNLDTIDKGYENIFNPFVRPHKKWRPHDKKTLHEKVIETAIQRRWEPMMAKIEELHGEMETCRTEEDKKRIDDEIIKRKMQIKDVEKLPEFELIGTRDKEHDWMKISAQGFDGNKSPLECELIWKNELHPAINGDKWNENEFDMLKVLVLNYGENNWDFIAAELGTNRTPFQCFREFATKLRSTLKGCWTPEDDAYLINVVESCRIGDYIPWQQVCYYIEGRSYNQIFRRWYYHVNPEIRHGKWSVEEDNMLLGAVWVFGAGNWWNIKNFVPGRTDLQCRERWGRVLDPSLNFNGWTKPEDKLIKQYVELFGQNWAKIKKLLPGRSDKMIANRYETLKAGAKRMKDDDLDFASKLEAVNCISRPQTKRLRRRNRLYKKLFVRAKIIRLIHIVNTNCNVGSGSVVIGSGWTEQIRKLLKQIGKELLVESSVLHQSLKTAKSLPYYHRENKKVISASEMKLDRQLMRLTNFYEKQCNFAKLAPKSDDEIQQESVRETLAALEKEFKVDDPKRLTEKGTDENRSGIRPAAPNLSTINGFKNLLLMKERMHLVKRAAESAETRAERRRLTTIKRKTNQTKMREDKEKEVEIRLEIVRDDEEEEGDAAPPALRNESTDGFCKDQKSSSSNQEYRELFLRFAGLFLWPAILTDVMPSRNLRANGQEEDEEDDEYDYDNEEEEGGEDDEGEPKRKKMKGGNFVGKNEAKTKKQKKWTRGSNKRPKKKPWVKECRLKRMAEKAERLRERQTQNNQNTNDDENGQDGGERVDAAETVTDGSETQMVEMPHPVAEPEPVPGPSGVPSEVKRKRGRQAGIKLSPYPKENPRRSQRNKIALD